MTLRFIIILTIYSFGMACGQILFKLAAESVQRSGLHSSPSSYINVYLILGVSLYFCLTILWVWLLRFVSLSAAYPFVALAFIFTPLLATVIFGEKLTLNYLGGMALIACGILIIARQ
jgi:drug/metabolite transporter (DMT)-like permease